MSEGTAGSGQSRATSSVAGTWLLKVRVITRIPPEDLESPRKMEGISFPLFQTERAVSGIRKCICKMDKIEPNVAST